MDYFYNDYIKIDENGIDLLRNSFPIEHLDFSIIRGIEISDGYLLKNRFIILLVGVSLIILAVKLLMFEFPIFDNFSSVGHFGIGFIKILIMPLFILCFAIYCLIQSFKRSKILKIKLENKFHDIRIFEIQRQGKLEEMIMFLDGKVKLEII